MSRYPQPYDRSRGGSQRRQPRDPDRIITRQPPPSHVPTISPITPYAGEHPVQQFSASQQPLTHAATAPTPPGSYPRAHVPGLQHPPHHHPASPVVPPTSSKPPNLDPRYRPPPGYAPSPVPPPHIPRARPPPAQRRLVNQQPLSHSTSSSSEKKPRREPRNRDLDAPTKRRPKSSNGKKETAEEKRKKKTLHDHLKYAVGSETVADSAELLLETVGKAAEVI